MPERKKLIEGYQRFYQHYFVENPELYNKLFQGQEPKILVIACCDSRVHPEQIMDADPGDMFVIRNVANVVPVNEVDGKSHGTSSAMEFAVKHLQVKHVIIMGHSQCGGIKALMEGDHRNEDYGFIDPWMKQVEDAREKVLSERGRADFAIQCRHCELESIKISMKNLMTFPWIEERCKEGKLSVHGWYFDIKTGALLALEDNTFKPVNALKIPSESNQ